MRDGGGLGRTTLDPGQVSRVTEFYTVVETVLFAQIRHISNINLKSDETSVVARTKPVKKLLSQSLVGDWARANRLEAFLNLRN